MNEEKLIPDTNLIRQLADYIEEIPKKRFNFAHWFHGIIELLTLKAPLDCGTTACALGWATTMKVFKDKGLRVCGSSIALKDDRSENAIAHKVFGVSADVFHRLFVPSDACKAAATGRQWATHARKIADELDQTHRTTNGVGKAWVSAQVAATERKPTSLANS